MFYNLIYKKEVYYLQFILLNFLSLNLSFSVVNECTIDSFTHDKQDYQIETEGGKKVDTLCSRNKELSIDTKNKYLICECPSKNQSLDRETILSYEFKPFLSLIKQPINSDEQFAFKLEFEQINDPFDFCLQVVDVNSNSWYTDRIKNNVIKKGIYVVELFEFRPIKDLANLKSIKSLSITFSPNENYWSFRGVYCTLKSIKLIDYHKKIEQKYLASSRINECTIDSCDWHDNWYDIDQYKGNKLHVLGIPYQKGNKINIDGLNISKNLKNLEQEIASHRDWYTRIHNNPEGYKNCYKFLDDQPINSNDFILLCYHLHGLKLITHPIISHEQPALALEFGEINHPFNFYILLIGEGDTKWKSIPVNSTSIKENNYIINIPKHELQKKHNYLNLVQNLYIFFYPTQSETFKGSYCTLISIKLIDGDKKTEPGYLASHLFYSGVNECTIDSYRPRNSWYDIDQYKGNKLHVLGIPYQKGNKINIDGLSISKDLRYLEHEIATSKDWYIRIHNSPDGYKQRYEFLDDQPIHSNDFILLCYHLYGLKLITRPIISQEQPALRLKFTEINHPFNFYIVLVGEGNTKWKSIPVNSTSIKENDYIINIPKNELPKEPNGLNLVQNLYIFFYPAQSKAFKGSYCTLKSIKLIDSSKLSNHPLFQQKKTDEFNPYGSSNNNNHSSSHTQTKETFPSYPRSNGSQNQSQSQPSYARSYMEQEDFISTASSSSSSGRNQSTNKSNCSGSSNNNNHSSSHTQTKETFPSYPRSNGSQNQSQSQPSYARSYTEQEDFISTASSSSSSNKNSGKGKEPDRTSENYYRKTNPGHSTMRQAPIVFSKNVFENNTITNLFAYPDEAAKKVRHKRYLTNNSKKSLIVIQQDLSQNCNDLSMIKNSIDLIHPRNIQPEVLGSYSFNDKLIVQEREYENNPDKLDEFLKEFLTYKIDEYSLIAEQILCSQSYHPEDPISQRVEELHIDPIRFEYEGIYKDTGKSINDIFQEITQSKSIQDINNIIGRECVNEYYYLKCEKTKKILKGGDDQYEHNNLPDNCIKFRKEIIYKNNCTSGKFFVLNELLNAFLNNNFIDLNKPLEEGAIQIKIIIENKSGKQIIIFYDNSLQGISLDIKGKIVK